LELIDEIMACSVAVPLAGAGASRDTTCKYIEQTTRCYPKCMCDDAEFAKEFESMMESARGLCGSVTCGPKPPEPPKTQVVDAASGLRATALSTTLLAALVAVVAACPR
jgi:hypothetical protein